MAVRLKVLSELTHAFAEATPNLDVLHDTIARRLTELVRDGCGLLLLSDDGRQLDMVSVHASCPDLLRASRELLARRPVRIDENPLLERVLHSGEPYLTPVVASDRQAQLAPAYNEVSKRFAVHSRLTVALRLRSKPIGILNMIRFRPDSPAFEERDVELLQIVADNAALAITNARSYAAERAARLAAEGVERTLRDYQDRLQQMAFDAAVAEERERHRLAVLLHDGIGQDLTLAQMKLSALRPQLHGAQQSTLDEALSLLTKSAHDRSTLTFELSPPLLYDLGLKPALSWLIEDMEARRGLRVKLVDDGLHKPLGETSAAIVFRSVRELLLNVCKHASSKFARVELRRVGGQLEVLVEDEGVGFESRDLRAGTRRTGFGLLSVREQISRLGGLVEIESALGHGTRARVRLPLALDGEDNAQQRVQT